MHISWRKKIANYLPNRDQLTILDLATGTADVLLTLCSSKASIESAVGIDLADKMLEVGKKKSVQRGLENKITLQHGDANQILFTADSFDVTTMAFGIRNVENTIFALKEIYRVLKKGGRVLILEFSLPENPLLKFAHLLYLRTFVPFIGGLFSGNFKAYLYLNKTIEKFPYGEHFCRLLKQVGLKNVKANTLLGGIATIYQGDRENAQQ